ncbi:MAG TPA: SH3 domain-containing protein [Burkholderiales bacterium]|nr:SH3 domain-containing protein [Burkholderiales bacterium]
MKRLALLLFFFPLLALAEPANVIRATELKQEPATDSATLAALPENASVEALERKGGWTRVKTSSGEGWVRMLALRYKPGTAKAGDSGAKELFNVARTGSSGTQTTTGVRGLSAEQIANAQPNLAEMNKLKEFAADRGTAGGFAAEGNLAAKAVEYPKP